MCYGGDVDLGPFLNVVNWVLTSIALRRSSAILPLHEALITDQGSGRCSKSRLSRGA